MNGIKEPLVMIAGLGGVLIPNHARSQAVERPNIIFILTDDQRWDAVGYAGNNIVHTPVIDSLARNGAIFTNTFVTTPISAASRASILTGLYERTHTYTFEQGDLKEDYRDLCYPRILKDNGYSTAFFGKLGVRIPGAGDMFDIFDSYDRLSRYPDIRGYYYKTIDGDTVHLTTYTGWQAREFIKNYHAGQPFCLSLSFSAPHAHDPASEQYFWTEYSDCLYGDITIPPPVLADDIYFERLPKEVRNGFNRLRWTWRYDDPVKYQHSMKGYYRMISDIDREIGSIVRTLSDAGMAENTVIIFMGDNGYFTGERQLAGKWLMYDNSLRVPLFIYDPRSPKGSTVEDITLNIDIAPTILSIAGLEAPAVYQGRDISGYLGNISSISYAPEYFLCEHLWEKKEIPSSEGIRSSKWKYFRYRFIEGAEELYDLENDPLETHDLSGSSPYLEILEDLRNKCDSLTCVYTESRIHD